MDELEQHLERLETTGLIRVAQLMPEIEYLFRHALVQDAVYGSMLRQDRKSLHRAVALAIEAMYADRAEELAPVLAMHFAQAEDDPKALHYYAMAGDAAAARYANIEAIQMFARGMEIEKRSPGGKLAQVFLGHGRACEFIGDYERALATYIALETIARERGDKDTELAALTTQATIRITTTTVHDPQEGGRLLNAALSLARDLGDRAAESRIEWNLMLFHKFAGRGKEAVMHGEASLAIARELNLREQMAFTMNDLVTHGYLDAGDFASARKLVEEVPALWRELGNQAMLADSLASAGAVHYFMGDYARAIQMATEARTITETIGNKWGQSFSRFMTGQLYFSRGEIDTALETMRTSIMLGEESGFMGAVVGVGADLALLLSAIGQHDEAYQRALKARTVCEELLPGWLNVALAAQTLVLCRRGDQAGAEQVAAQLSRMIEPGEYMTFPSSKSMTFLALAEVRLAGRDIAGAHHVLDAIETYVEQTQMRTYVPEMLVLRGRTYLAQNETAAARAAFEKARDAAQALGSKWVLWQALAELANIAEAGEAEQIRAEAADVVRWAAGQIADVKTRETFLGQKHVKAVLGG